MTFGETLKELRKERGLTQAELADILGLSAQRISLYENGREPEYEILIAMADYFGVLVDYLIGRTRYETVERAMKYQEALTRIESANMLTDYKVEFESEDFFDDDSTSVNVIYSEGKRVVALSNDEYKVIKKQWNDIFEILVEPYKNR